MEAVPAVSGKKATFRSIKDTVNLVTVGWRSLETRHINSQVEMFYKIIYGYVEYRYHHDTPVTRFKVVYFIVYYWNLISVVCGWLEVLQDNSITNLYIKNKGSHSIKAFLSMTNTLWTALKIA